jgi:hypothetical protein
MMGSADCSLIGTVNRHVQVWVLVDVSERQSGVDDELFALEAWSKHGQQD